MFNIGKSNEDKVDNIKENATTLLDTTQENLAELASDVKHSVTKASNKIEGKTSEAVNNTKDDAMTLINNLKALLSENTNSTKIQDAKQQAFDKASEWKILVQDEVTRAIETTNAKTKKAVTEQPLLSLGIAVAAGVLLGYVLGHKQSDK